MKLLVLGSQGFIGRYLAEDAVARGWSVVGCDLTEAGATAYPYHKISLLSGDFEQLFAGNQYDFCINAAGSGSVPFSLSHPLSDFEANVTGVIHVLEAIRRNNPTCGYLHISSAAVYGNPAQLPIEESALLAPLSPYGWHKKISEELCLAYSQQFGIRTAITRPFSVYGPGLRKQLFWDVCQKLLKAEGSLELWGTGQESRDFIFVGDLVHAIWAIITKGALQGDVYNVATGVETTIKDAVGLFVQSLQKEIKVVFNQQVRPGDPLYWRADISRLSNLGFRPTFSLQEGIRVTADWIRSDA